MKIINSTLLGLDGEPLRTASIPGIPPKDTDPEITVARALINAAMDQPRNGRVYSAEQNVSRLDAALMLHKLRPGDAFVLADELVADLEINLTYLYGPIVTGQVVKILRNAKVGRAA